MDLSEIEEGYKKEIDDSERVFMEDTKKGMSTSEAEIKYSESLKKARENYMNLLGQFLSKEKNAKPTKSNKPSKKGKDHCEVDTSSTDIGLFERIRLGVSLFLFRLGFTIRNFVRKFIPNYFLFVYYRIKIKYLRVFRKISAVLRIIENKIEDIKSKAQELLKKSSQSKS